MKNFVKKSALFVVLIFISGCIVVMFFPTPNKLFDLPQPGEVFSLTLAPSTFPEHKRDVEALFVIAIDQSHQADFNVLFSYGKEIEFIEFFENYSKIADYCENVTLPYEVIDPHKQWIGVNCWNDR
ncbi:hypothetical protein GMMP15_2040003 [Candidatus Magnetomoraceae bacterium gMMP-15]